MAVKMLLILIQAPHKVAMAVVVMALTVLLEIVLLGLQLRVCQIPAAAAADCYGGPALTQVQAAQASSFSMAP